MANALSVLFSDTWRVTSSLLADDAAMRMRFESKDHSFDVTLAPVIVGQCCPPGFLIRDHVVAFDADSSVSSEQRDVILRRLAAIPFPSLVLQEGRGEADEVVARLARDVWGVFGRSVWPGVRTLAGWTMREMEFVSDEVRVRLAAAGGEHMLLCFRDSAAKGEGGRLIFRGASLRAELVPVRKWPFHTVSSSACRLPCATTPRSSPRKPLISLTSREIAHFRPGNELVPQAATPFRVSPVSNDDGCVAPSRHGPPCLRRRALPSPPDPRRKLGTDFGPPVLVPAATEDCEELVSAVQKMARLAGELRERERATDGTAWQPDRTPVGLRCRPHTLRIQIGERGRQDESSLVFHLGARQPGDRLLLRIGAVGVTHEPYEGPLPFKACAVAVGEAARRLDKAPDGRDTARWRQAIAWALRRRKTTAHMVCSVDEVSV